MHRVHRRIITGVSLIVFALPTRRAHAEDEPTPAPPAAASPSEPSEHLTRAPDAPPPTFEHARGFGIDARLPVRPADGALGVLSGMEAPISLGYRGRNLAVLVGPLFGRTSTAHSCGPDCETTLTRYGAQLRVDLTIVRADDGHLEAFVPLGVTLLGNIGSTNAQAPSYASVTSGEVAWGANVGIGARYWLTRHLAAFSELSLGWTDRPSFSFVPPHGGSRDRSGSLGGAIGVAYAF